jgi:hypothetical protein
LGNFSGWEILDGRNGTWYLVISNHQLSLVNIDILTIHQNTCTFWLVTCIYSSVGDFKAGAASGL